MIYLSARKTKSKFLNVRKSRDEIFEQKGDWKGGIECRKRVGMRYLSTRETRIEELSAGRVGILFEYLL